MLIFTVNKSATKQKGNYGCAGEIKNSSEAITQWINQLTYNEQ